MVRARVYNFQYPGHNWRSTGLAAGQTHILDIHASFIYLDATPQHGKVELSGRSGNPLKLALAADFKTIFDLWSPWTGFILYRNGCQDDVSCGRAHIKIDPKGRLSLPTSFRAALGKSNRVFITNSLYQGRRFLDFYNFSEWQKLEKRITRMPNLKVEVQAFQRFYLSSARKSAALTRRESFMQHLRATTPHYKAI